MTNLWTHKPIRVTDLKKGLRALMPALCFFPAVLADLIKYINWFAFRAEREQEPVTVIRSALH